jgi:oxygen-independent coproporphyrinogen-3 oxidase
LLSSKREIVNAIVKEIEIRSDFLNNNKETDIQILSFPNEKIETVYFGGGTPSLLSEEELVSILSAIKTKYHVSNKAEITLEANPDDISFQKLSEWKKAGINRLSIGIQSFVERDLLWMNRAHSASQALESIRLARETGFDNFSIDLIFGTPNLSEEEWRQNVQKVIDLQVPHIASYALTVEPKTALDKMIRSKKKEDVDNETQASQYLLLMKMLREGGYEHYEISNFAKPGFRSRHNSSYWQGEKYIGIGPSAHSYNGKMRMWNKPNNAIYIKSISENSIPFEREILTPTQQLNEYIMTSLRTMEGLDLQFVEHIFSRNERNRIELLISHEIDNMQAFLKEEKIILTDEGKLFADAIAVKLFVD